MYAGGKHNTYYYTILATERSWPIRRYGPGRPSAIIMNMSKALVFDFFDVIRTDAFKAWMNKNQYSHEDGYGDASAKMDKGEIDRNGFLECLSNLSGKSIGTVCEEMDRSAQIDWEVVALIAELKRHYKIGLLSNSAASFLRQLLKAHDIEKYFDEIVASSEVGYAKPQPEIFQIMMSKLGLRPQEIVFIDDNKKHVDAAAALGIKALLYTDCVELKKDLKSLNVL